jgi:NAD(P)-dependent dehydrogenase (short-subunit alcohol dehydrogenase family)
MMSKAPHNTAFNSLSGQVAIVTGAGRRKGMGWAAAMKFAQLGARVVVTDIGRKREDLEIPGMLQVGSDVSVLEQLVSEKTKRAIADDSGNQRVHT